jgi:hypothetical protein
MMSLSIADKPPSAIGSHGDACEITGAVLPRPDSAVISDLLIMPMGDGNAPLVVNIAWRS